MQYLMINIPANPAPHLVLPMGNGHYSVELPCGMAGQWEFDIQVGSEGKQGAIRLLVDILQ